MEAEKNLKFNYKIKSEQFKNLLNSGQFSDIEFLVGTEERKTFKCHKFMLSVKNEVFEAMFSDKFKNKKVSFSFMKIL